MIEFKIHKILLNLRAKCEKTFYKGLPIISVDYGNNSFTGSTKIAFQQFSA